LAEPIVLLLAVHDQKDRARISSLGRAVQEVMVEPLVTVSRRFPVSSATTPPARAAYP
jgi:hypothetical protein